MAFIWKTTKKFYRANIMILVLFIMFVSSLLWLLVSQYVKHLIKVSGLFQNYYRSYYYAYGGLELGLAQVKHHEYGFEQWIDNEYKYTDFSECQLGTWKCEAKIMITSRWNPVADTYDDTLWWCSDLLSSSWTSSKYYEVSSGNAVILPLFYDMSTWFDTVSYHTIDNAEFTGMQPSLYAYGASWSETYIIKVIDEDLNDYSTSSVTPTVSNNDTPYSLTGLTYTASWTNKWYLVIANKEGETKYFCLQFYTPSDKMVSKYVVVESIGKYGNSTVSLSAIKTDQLPSFLVYGTINGW